MIGSEGGCQDHRKRAARFVLVAVAVVTPLMAGSRADAGFAIAKDNRPDRAEAAVVTDPAQDRPRPKVKPKPRPHPQPAVVHEAPPPPMVVAVAPPPPAPRPEWPAPAGWSLAQASTVCTLQQLPAKAGARDAVTFRLLDWKPRQPTVEEVSLGRKPASRAELQVDLADEIPAATAARGVTLEIGKARFALQPNPGNPHRLQTPATEPLLAAIAAGGKSRVSIEGRKAIKFKLTDGAAALAAFDACMENARQQPLPIVASSGD